jgi:hypothetical protein
MAAMSLGVGGDEGDQPPGGRPSALCRPLGELLIGDVTHDSGKMPVENRDQTPYGHRGRCQRHTLRSVCP